MFVQSKPIWLREKECEMNTYAVFRTKVNIPIGAELHITGATFYRVFVNGIFVGFGPARTAAGYAREDVFSLEGFKAECEIVIEAVGYYCRSLSTVIQPSFLIAEIQCQGEILAYTGKDFEGFAPKHKVREVERYSVQRHFSEVWDYCDGRSQVDKRYRTPIEVLPEMPQILERRAPYPMYEDVDLEKAQCKGTLSYDENRTYRDKYTWEEIPGFWGRFDWSEIKYRPYIWIQRHKQIMTESESHLPMVLNQGEYTIFDFGRIEAGFLRSTVKALEKSDVVIGFCEYYPGEEFVFGRINIHNGLEYLFPEGAHREVMSFEPYTFRYVLVAVKEGRVQLDSFGMKTFMFDISHVEYQECDHNSLNALCQAAVRTFVHNAVDLYMDCPSRERAGWLCDSYFTAKTEYALTGKTKVEDAFLENYRLYKNEGEYPKGVLPMCYPADKIPDTISNQTFIPQWTMWYILEVEEYVHKRGHEDMAEDFRESIYGLLEFYRNYENEDGLLERLPSWNFVEWSEANTWTWDVNYPTNFLYAEVLECIWKLYGDVECKRRCENVRKKTIEQSYNGEYFVDHAVRDEHGRLCRQAHASEACQYYAVLFGEVDIDAKEYQTLKQLILHVFTPDRSGVMPEIMEVNAFIGAYLRLEVLRKMEEYQLLLKDVEGFFGKMQEHTGTLWEYRELKGSHDHGFASYAYVVIQEALEYFRKEKGDAI